MNSRDTSIRLYDHPHTCFEAYWLRWTQSKETHRFEFADRRNIRRMNQWAIQIYCEPRHERRIKTTVTIRKRNSSWRITIHHKTTHTWRMKMRYTKDHSQTISERWATWWRNDQKEHNNKYWQSQEGWRIAVEVINDSMNSQNYDTRITTRIKQLTILKYSIKNELFIQWNAYNDRHKWWQREKHKTMLKRSYDQFTTIKMRSIFEFRATQTYDKKGGDKRHKKW